MPNRGCLFIEFGFEIASKYYVLQTIILHIEAILGFLLFSAYQSTPTLLIIV